MINYLSWDKIFNWNESQQSSCFCFSNCVLMTLFVLITPISEAVKSNTLLRG